MLHIQYLELHPEATKGLGTYMLCVSTAWWKILRWRRKFQQSTYTARVTMLTYLCSRNTLCVWYHKTQYQESTQFVSVYINFLPIIVCHAMPQTWCFLLILQCYAGWSTLKQPGTVKKMNENNRALLYMGMAHDT